MNFFDYFKDMIRRWLKDVQDHDASNKVGQLPNYKHNGEVVTFDIFEKLSLKE